MRNHIMGAIGWVWGAGILAYFVFGGLNFQAALSSYTAGQLVGLGLGVGLFVVGFFYLVNGSSQHYLRSSALSAGMLMLVGAGVGGFYLIRSMLPLPTVPLSPKHHEVVELAKLNMPFLATGVPEGKDFTLYLSKDVVLKMVRIEPGKFLMGSPQAEQEEMKRLIDPIPSFFEFETQHEVEITRPFYMGIYEVTQAQFETIMHSNHSTFKGPDLPVENVRWVQAAAFCEQLTALMGATFDLPTEAEWEYACRAGTKTMTHFGNALTHKHANFNCDVPLGKGARKPMLNKTTPVGSYPPNAFGLYDMHGNVAEWCKDIFEMDAYRSAQKQDPQGTIVETGSRVMRGGGCDSTGIECRSAQRSADERNGINGGGYAKGFRVVLRLPADNSAVQADLKLLQGTWRAVKVVHQGIEQKGGFTWTKIGNRSIYPDGAFDVDRLNPSTSPRQFDSAIFQPDGKIAIGRQGKQSILKGIYSIEGDTCTICVAVDPDAPRPTAFASAPGTMDRLIVLKRVKE